MLHERIIKFRNLIKKKQNFWTCEMQSVQKTKIFHEINLYNIGS